MVLVNLVVYAVLEILHGLVSMHNFLKANDCWHKQN